MKTNFKLIAVAFTVIAAVVIYSCSKENSSNISSESNSFINEKVGNRGVKVLENLDLIEKAFVKLALNLTICNTIADEAKKTGFQDLIFDISTLENVLTVKGIDLLTELKNSLIAQNASQQDLQKIDNIYKSFKISQDDYFVQIFIPFLDSTVFNQQLNLNNIPSFITSCQFYSKDSIPSKTAISGADIVLNETTALQTYNWFITFEIRQNGIFVDDPFMLYTFLAKCYCHPSGEPNKPPVCEEGKCTTCAEIRCGRKIFGSCTGGCGSNN